MTGRQDVEVKGRLGENTQEKGKTGLFLAWHLPSEKTSVSHSKGNAKCDVTAMESWAHHTAWVSSTDKKGDKKQQMGHVFTKTTLQDTGLLCSNEVVVPSLRWLVCSRSCESKHAAHSQKSSRQTGADRFTCKKALKSEATATPPPHTHTLTSALGHHPRNHSVAGWGGREGEGSCHWDHGIQPGWQPAFLLLLVRLCLPGGCRGQEAAALQSPQPLSASQSQDGAAATQIMCTSRSRKSS